MIQTHSMLERHRAEDQRCIEPDLAHKATQRINRLTKDVAQIRQWLNDHPADRQGSRGAIRKPVFGFPNLLSH